MILNRSMSVHVASLALAALALTSTSCFGTRTRHQRAVAVKAEAEADLAYAQADAVRSQQLREPEYVEADEAPAVPAARPEQRPSAPSPGHVWIAGQHTRRGGQWVWVSGHYALPPRSDVVWVPGHWVPHLHGYAWIAGAWR